MATNEEIYEIEFAEEYGKEVDKIYNYISKDLCADVAAKRLLAKIEEKIIRLKNSPEMYAEVRRYEGTRRIYRRLVVDNYVVLYTIDKGQKMVYIAHIYYGGSDYMNKI